MTAFFVGDEMGVAVKTCSKCGESKPLDQFNRDASRRDGRGYHCRDCRTTGQAQPRIAAAEAAFRARLAELGAELLEPRWLGAIKPHRVRCAAGHECRPRPNTMQQGGGICRTCAGNDPAATESAFRARLTELGAELLEPYKSTRHPHRVRCAAGHECAAWPDSLRREGRGICRACAGLDPAAAEAAFRTRLAELGGVLLEPRWLGTRTPHRVRCAAGHECAPRPNHVQKGNGICRFCAGQIWDAFYVVTDHGQQRMKLGITSGDPRPRLRTHRAAGYREVVRLMVGLPGDTAPEIERAALATLRLAGVQPIYGREYYDASTLPLVLDVADNYPIPHQEMTA